MAGRSELVGVGVVGKYIAGHGPWIQFKCTLSQHSFPTCSACQSRIMCPVPAATFPLNSVPFGEIVNKDSTSITRIMVC